MGAGGIVSAIWLFVRAKRARNADAASVDPARTKSRIKTWVIVGIAFATVYTLLAVAGFVDVISISLAVNWSVSITALLFWIGILFAVTGQYSAARIFFLIGGILGLPLSVPMIIAGKRLELAGQALARAEQPVEQARGVAAPKSAFADQLICRYCGTENRATQWPTEGDSIPFAYEAAPGDFNLKVHCAHCERDWYVVWDENPGPLETLALTDSIQSAM